MSFRQFIIAGVIILMAVSCEKKEQPSGSGVPICFGVKTMQVQTKGIYLTRDNLASDATVIVKAKQGNADISYSNNTNLRILPETTGSNNWFPAYGSNNYGNNSWRDWDRNSRYSFQAYAYSPKNQSGLLTINSVPTNITVHQPKTYSYLNESTTMLDYLLSHKVDNVDGSKKPVVNLLFEHALSMVEVYAIRDETITDVQITNLGLSGFYTDMNLVVDGDVASTNDAYTNWNSVTIGGTTRDGNYTLAGSSTNPYSTVTNNDAISFEDRYGTGAGKEQRPAIIRAITVPQTLQAKTTTEAGTLLTVSYRVNQAPHGQDPVWSSVYTQNFPLVASGLPSAWSAGYRYTYIIKIDTGVHFTGKVSRWLDGGNIEATILPEIKEDEL